MCWIQKKWKIGETFALITALMVLSFDFRLYPSADIEAGSIANLKQS